MIPKDGLTPQYFLAAFRRRFWYIVIPFFLVSLAAIFYCIRAPKVFMSSALILIQPQEVPSEYVRSTVTTDVQARINSIREQVMSRSRLEEIINKHGLYSEIRSSKTIYDAVEKMREDIEVNVKQDKTSRRRGDEPAAFEVSYQGRNPTRVRDVTADVSNLFIDHNYRLRAEQAAGTTQFLNRELSRMKEELRNKEEAVREFKEKYFGYLPEQMQNNFNILTRLQQQLDSINETLQKTEDRKILLQAQLGRLDTLQSGSLSASGENARPLTLEQMHQQLQALQARYSDKHPDVVRLKSTIAKMENEQGISSPETTLVESGIPAAASDAQRLVSVEKDNTQIQLRLIDAELQSLRLEKEKASTQIREYQQRIESGPKVEQMFVDLRRDYERASENYQSLLEKKLEAELAENLERTQKGEQFKILDHANLPQKPAKPNIPKILAMGLMMALGCGLGLAFLREYLDPTFWSRKEVESMLELPVLISIPIITTERERRFRKIKLAAGVCVLLVMSSTLLFALFVLLKRNPTLLPLPL
jgi:polysaccharide chain length determinant protein (PEP-CTERM system associated)